MRRSRTWRAKAQRTLQRRRVGRGREVRRCVLLRRRQRHGHDRRLASLDLTTGMTLKAWVQPVGDRLADRGDEGAARGPRLRDRCVHPTRAPSGTSSRGGSARVADAALAANTWTHLATTYDGTDLRLYVNGTSCSTTVARDDHDLDRRPSDRREHDLGGGLPGADRRGPRLQPRADRRRRSSRTWRRRLSAPRIPTQAPSARVT